MRIVLSNSSSRWGGVHVVTEMLARGLTSLGHDVTVFGYPGGMLEQRMKGVVSFEPIIKGMDLHPVTLVRTARALRRHRAQVVLAMMKKDVRLTVPAARVFGIPSVVRHANDRALTGWIYDRVFFGMIPKHHVVNSIATRRTLLKSAAWIDASNVTVIHNGIDPAAFENAVPADLGVPGGAKVIGFIGRLETRKGLLDLARAWRSILEKLPDAWLVIVGKGPDEQQARGLLGDAPNVRWLGYRSDVASLLASMHVLAMPSHWEGFGLAAVEAMAAGVPVVATDASSLPEIITDGVSGRLVPPRNPDALAAAIVTVASDPVMRANLAEGGRQRVRAEFGVERMVKGYERVLAEVVGATSV